MEPGRTDGRGVSYLDGGELIVSMNCRDQDNQIAQNPCIGKPSTIARGYGGMRLDGGRPNALLALRMRQEVTWCGHVGCSPLHPSKIERGTLGKKKTKKNFL